MATNLVSLVMQFLTPDMVGRIATALGLDRNKVQSAISGAVPGLLAARLKTLLTCLPPVDSPRSLIRDRSYCRHWWVVGTKMH